MKMMLLTLSTPMFALCAVAIFVVLFATILRTLKEMQLFTPGATIIIALCVSLLCLIGLHHFLLSGEGGHELSGQASRSSSQTGIEIILLPYAGLAIAIILCLLVLGISRILPVGKRAEHPPGKQTTVIKSEKHQNRNEEKRIRK